MPNLSLHHTAGVHLLVPDIESIRENYDASSDAFPYWARVWPSAVALTSVITAKPQLVEGKSVLELAAGLGLPSLASALYARSVTCTDIFPEAVEVVRQSVQYNGFTNVYCRVMDIGSIPSTQKPDIVLLSDIHYDPLLLADVTAAIDRFLQEGASMLLSTPHRIIARDFLLPFMDRCRMREEHIINGTPVSVFLFSQFPISL